MNTLDKVYNLTIDIKNIDTKYNSYAKFFDDDRETSVIKIKLLNDNHPINLENCSVEAYFILANNTYHNEACKIINSSEGIVELQLCQKCLVKGKNIVRLSILKENEIANTPVITYEVRKGLYSDNPSFNDDPLTPILSQMLLDIKVTKVNQIELQERFEKTLPKIEGKIKEVESLVNSVNLAIASGTQDLEVKEARANKKGIVYAKLGDRLNEVDSQLEHKANQVELETERKRIDLLTKLENEQTEGNTELLDIRVGANGVAYDTAGDSVRQQFLEVDAKLNGGELIAATKTGTYFDNFENIASNEIRVSSSEEVNAFSYLKNLAPFSLISKSSDNITIDEETDEYIIMTIQPNASWQNIKLKSFFIPSGKYVFTRSVEYLKGNSVNNAFTVYMDYSENGDSYTSDRRIAIPSTVEQTIAVDTIGGWRNVAIHITLATPFDVETKVKLYKFGCFKSDVNDYGEYEKYLGQHLKGTSLKFNYIDGIKIYTDKEATISYQSNVGNSMSLDKIREVVSKHESEIEKIKENNNNESLNTVVCWGDSLTNGAGSTTLKPSSDTNSDTSYPAVLSRLIKSNIKTLNGGVGGETSWMIASRQGAMSIKVEPMTIPAGKVATRVYLKGMEQDYFYNVDNKKWTYSEGNLSYNFAVDGNALVNPCYIDGIEGILSRTKLLSGTPDPETGETVQGDVYAYYFTRSYAGEPYTFTTPKTLITNADKNYRDAINVIWMGQNDAPLHEGKYITQIGCEDRVKAMIDNLTHDNYIVMDLPSGDNSGSAERVQSFNQKFGKHYLNIREYICKYGLVIANELGANITLNEENKSDINIGKIPSCFRIDGVHGNYWYYQIVARAVYEKGQDLGYW